MRVYLRFGQKIDVDKFLPHDEEWKEADRRVEEALLDLQDKNVIRKLLYNN